MNIWDYAVRQVKSFKYFVNDDDSYDAEVRWRIGMEKDNFALINLSSWIHLKILKYNLTFVLSNKYKSLTINRKIKKRLEATD